MLQCRINTEQKGKIMKSAPSKLLLGAEAFRGSYEYVLGWLLKMPIKYISPKGDGHPVVVIPGLGTGDTSTYYIRNFLDDIGYQSHSWGQGRNLGPRNGLDKLLGELLNHITQIHELSGNQPVSIIGWSLGGIYAREIAKLKPEIIRQVITLGTPFNGEPASTNASFLYEMLSKDTSHKDPDVLKKISVPPPVPFTSLYSKTDGVVHWEASIEEPSHMTENIEVPGASHLGLAHNPISMYIIADRLTQNKHSWKPYNN